MFRKLQDRVVAAASNALGIATANSENALACDTTTIQRLQALGDYTVTEVESALNATGGNIDRAAEMLLSQQRTIPADNNAIDTMDEDMELQRALQQSLEVQEQLEQPSRSDIMNQAAESAFRRAEMSHAGKNNALAKKMKPIHSSAITPTTATKNRGAPPIERKEQKVAPVKTVRTKSQILRQHHPEVKLIPKLQDKSTEEQVLRTVDRMKNHPAAVDTLYRALYMIYHHPQDNLKYRRIDTSTPGYQRSVDNAPGTADFLRAMKFHNEQYHNTSPILVLSDPMYDPALIYLGLSALEQIKLSSEYLTAKKQMVFLKDVTALSKTTTTSTTNDKVATPTSPGEIQQQNYYLSLCPKEPSEGRGALLQIHVTDTYTIRRRFDSDDTMSDVLHWIAGTVGTTIYQRIIENIYCLIDVNHTNRIPINVSGPARHYTLQYVGCWPSGRLQLQPVNDTAMESTNNNADGNAKATAGTRTPAKYIKTGGTSRGLAAGTSSSDDE